MNLSIMTLCVLVLGIVVTNKREQEFIKKLDKKEHPLKSIYSLAAVIFSLLDRIGVTDIFGNSVQLREIYIEESIESAKKKQAYRSIASVIAIVCGLCVLVILYSLASESYLVDGKYIKRTPSGGGNKSYSLVYAFGENEEFYKEVTVNEVRRKGDELEKLKNYSRNFLDKEILANNSGATEVMGSLNLVKEIPGTNVKVSWDDEYQWLISADGTIKNENIDEPVVISIHAELSYFDEIWDYVKELIIMPKEQSKEERVELAIDEYISDFNETHPYDEMFELPEIAGGESVLWKEQEDTTISAIVVLGLVAAVMIIPALKQDIKKKQKQRADGMLKDYSDIVSKFVMLLTAGMTCRGAWSKICTDYLKDKENKKVDEIQYAYEEMLISYRELQLGKPEVRVYEDFGLRCNIMQYQRFGTLLARNIKRGSASIISMLEMEAADAFSNRRDSVRQKGEEAGTKLLLPMFGMLIIVFAIVIVPAFSSF